MQTKTVTTVGRDLEQAFILQAVIVANDHRLHDCSISIHITALPYGHFQAFGLTVIETLVYKLKFVHSATEKIDFGRQQPVIGVIGVAGGILCHVYFGIVNPSTVIMIGIDDFKLVEGLLSVKAFEIRNPCNALAGAVSAARLFALQIAVVNGDTIPPNARTVDVEVLFETCEGCL